MFIWHDVILKNSHAIPIWQHSIVKGAKLLFFCLLLFYAGLVFIGVALVCLWITLITSRVHKYRAWRHVLILCNFYLSLLLVFSDAPLDWCTSSWCFLICCTLCDFLLEIYYFGIYFNAFFLCVELKWLRANNKCECKH